MIAAGQTSALAATGNGNGGGGNPSPGGQHGQDCTPGSNDTATGSCEHNGSGGGNCGDNQSGNDNGLGNDGNDNGFGHKGDACDTTTPPSNPPANPPATPTPPGTPNPPTTPSPPQGDPGSGPLTPPSVACAASLHISGTRFIVGRRAILVVGVRTSDGTPLRGTSVLVRGAGIRLTALTNTAGSARFIVRPRSAGVIRIGLAQPSSCASLSRLARATDVFKPPKPNFTG